MVRSDSIILLVGACLGLLQGCHNASSLNSPDPQTPWKAPEAIAFPVFQKPEFDFKVPLTLSDCLWQALENQPATKRSWNQSLAQAAYYHKTQATLLPTGGVTLGVEHQDMKFKTTTRGTSSKVDQTLKGGGINLQWLLFSFGARTALIESALHQLYGANFQYNQALQQVALQVQLSFCGLQSAKAQVVAALASFEEAKSVAEAVQIKFTTGLADEQERLRSQAEEASQRYALQASYGVLEAARAQLAEAIGIPVDPRLDVVAPDLSTPTPLCQSTVEGWLEEAMTERPMLRAAYEDWQRFEYEAKAAKKALFPQLIATAQASRYKGIRNGLRPDQDITVGIGLQWNIFDFAQDRYTASQARHQADAAKEAYRAQQLAVATDIWKSFYAYQAAIGQVEAAKDFVASAHAAFKATQIGYQTGIKDLTSLLQAQDMLTKSRFEQVDAYRQAQSAWASLVYAAGHLSDDSKHFRSFNT